MRRKAIVQAFAIVGALLMVSTIGAAAMVGHNAAEARGQKISATTYQDQWRLVWEDHITWTRVVIIAVLDGLPSGAVDNYTARLLQNPGDMGKLLKPIYGTDNAMEFSDLVTQHLVVAAQILSAIKNGQDPTSLLTSWYQNAHQIAVLMNELNPNNWGLKAADKMWKEHLDATVNETLANFGHDWTAEVAAYNKIVSLAMMMADFTSFGIMKQFPQMFNGLGIVSR